MRRSVRFGILVCGLTTELAAPALAQTPAPAVVWYRASEQCPTGAAFLARLADKSSRARLAEPADHFDFLVTLVAGGGETVGRLERQTQSGTVAIRELRDRNCERVADALALGLSLALEPSSDGAAPPGADSAPDASAAITTRKIAAETGPTARGAPLGSEAAPTTAHSPSPAPTQNGTTRPHDVIEAPMRARASPWSMELAAAALEGSMPRPLWLGSLGIDRTWSHAETPSLLLSVTGVGGYGSAPTQVGPVKHWLAAGRAELCPYFLGSGRVELWPCGAVELGALGASDSRASGRSARDLWAAPGASLRLKYPASGPVAVSLRAAVLVPLVRDTVYAGTEALYSAEIVVFQAGVGVTARLW